MWKEFGLSWRPRHVVVCVLASLCVAAGAFLLARHQDGRWISRAEHEAFLSANAFSQMVSDWLAYDTDRQYERVSSAAEAMLLGDYLCVTVIHHGDVMIDARSPAWTDAGLPEDTLPRAGDDGRRVSTRNQDGDLVIEALVSLPGLEPRANYVRVAVRDESLRIHLRNNRLTLGAGAFALWVVGLFAGLILMRRSSAPDEGGSDGSAPTGVSDEVIEFGSLRIHRTRKTIALADRQLEFPPKLFHLLEMLASEPDQAFGAEEILKRVWADAQYASANDVRQSIYRLRRRLNQLQPGLGECIINIKGFGYRLDIERIPHPPEHEVASLV